MSVKYAKRYITTGIFILLILQYIFISRRVVFTRHEETRSYLTYVDYNGTSLLTVNVSNTGHGTKPLGLPDWLKDFVRYTLPIELEPDSTMPKYKLRWYHDQIKKDPPLGTWPKYDYEPLKKILEPAYMQSKADKLKVPPIVHFTWFYKKKHQTPEAELQFYHLISLLAAYKKIKPYKIIIWYDVMPAGIWWDYAVKHIPNLLMVYRETPLNIYGIRMQLPEHRSDVARLEAILVLGGIYLDLDAVALNSFDAFRNYSAVEGAPRPANLANSVIIGEPNNLFHWLFYLIYSHFDPNKVIETSVKLPMVLAKKYPETIHVDYKYLSRPNNAERIYFVHNGWLWDWSKHHCVHLYVRCNTTEYEFASTKSTNNVLGEIYRHILYDEAIPGDISKRPSLFDMSWAHQLNCRRRDFPKGLWNCTETETNYKRLNRTHDFYNTFLTYTC